MRILITNDDGIHAEGLSVLEEIAHTLTDDVWVIAPEIEQSGAAHSLTLRMPIRVLPLGPKRFAVHGTPTDCVMVGVRALMDAMPDLVLSGVNHGANLGDDITYSGTVAAAMEAALLDLPAIALSQETNYVDGMRWDYARMHAASLIRQALAAGIPQNTLLNINFPDPALGPCQGVEVTVQGNRKIGDNIHMFHDPLGLPVYWIGRKQLDGVIDPHSDYAMLEQGYITVTPIHLNLTDYKAMERFKGLAL